MRLDKFMKLTRLCKRRTAAQEMIDIGAVRIDQKLCKPSSEVKVGSVIEIAYAAHILKIEVTCVDEARLKRTSVGHYNVVQETSTTPDVRPW
jgi:ribosomal 50S subunit-recycling heat shock protein